MAHTKLRQPHYPGPDPHDCRIDTTTPCDAGRLSADVDSNFLVAQELVGRLSHGAWSGKSSPTSECPCGGADVVA